MDATTSNNGALSFMPPMPKNVLGNMSAGVAGVANPKKWGWPGYLTFGRSAANSRNTSPSRSEKPPGESSNGDTKSEDSSTDKVEDADANKAEEAKPEDANPDKAETSEVTETAVEVDTMAEPTSKALSSPVVDRHLLQDAIGASPITKPSAELTPAPEPEPDAAEEPRDGSATAEEDSEPTSKPEMDLASESTGPSSAIPHPEEDSETKPETNTSTSPTPTSEVDEPEPEPTPTGMSSTGLQLND